MSSIEKWFRPRCSECRKKRKGMAEWFTGLFICADCAVEWDYDFYIFSLREFTGRS